MNRVQIKLGCHPALVAGSGILLIISLFCPSLAYAGEEGYCGNFEMHPPISLAEVIGHPKEKIIFQQWYDSSNITEKEPSCPNLDINKCPMKRYLVSGNKVVTSHTYKEFTCAFYVNPKSGSFSAWIPTQNLKPIKTKESNLNKIEGSWAVKYNNLTTGEITISKTKNNILNIEGNAFYYGLNDNVNFGRINANAKLEGNKIQVIEWKDEYDNKINKMPYPCQIELQILNDFLIAKDNKNCGGHNVSFTGIYVKQKARQYKNPPFSWVPSEQNNAT